jgi:TonB-linked SusC/RagA family outer membrane protein
MIHSTFLQGQKTQGLKLFLLVFLLTFVGILKAQNVTQPIFLNLKNVTLREFFKEIESKTPFSIIYRDVLLDNKNDVSINVNNKPLNEILTSVLSTKGLTATFENNTIVITKLQAKPKTIASELIKISGQVVDEKGEPIIGATIKIENSNVGTITNANGEFNIDAHVGDRLLISYVGYDAKNITINEKTNNYKIVLTENAKILDEVVVVGYGEMKKSDLTGAVSSVKTENMTITSDASIGQLLKGKAAGITALSTSAQPGGGVRILIRGAASIDASNEPLYVIDGFPISNDSPEPGNDTQYSYGSRSNLNSLNPNDIESIEILKDASATAIYGARAANGVVLITTKRGKNGLKLNYSGSYTAQYINKPFEVYDATNYMIQTNQILRERWLREKKLYPYGTTDPSTVAPFSGQRFTQEQINNAGKGTNWWNEIMRPGNVQNHNISITFGNEKIRSYVSLGLYNNEGVVKGSAIKRISSKINLDYTINNFVQAGLSYMGAIINNNNVQMGEGEWGDSNMIMSALLFDPSVNVKDENGNYSEMSWYANLPNPVSYQDVNDKTKQIRNLSNFYLQIEPVNNLKIKSSIGYDGQSSVREAFFPKTFLLGKNKDGQASIGQANREDLLFNTVATYNFDLIKKHKFIIMTGYEYQQFNANGHSLGASDFFTDAFLYNNIGVGNQNKYSIGSYKSKEVLASYFGRINYNFLERYLLTLNLRYDGSDKFGKNNKWGFFPSASAGWRLSEEKFMKGFEKLSNLKLRVSYGQTGNSSIGSNAFAFYDPSSNRFAFNSTPVTGVELTQIDNNNLKWETTTEFNFGLDFGFYNNRISGAFELFDKTVSDLLGQRNLRSWMVVPTVAANLGKTQSRGVELTLNTVNIKTQDFQWSTDFTFTRYRDRWKERSPDVVLSPWQKVDDPIRAIYYWKTDGIIQIGETVESMPNAVPGNIKIKDVNGFDENMHYIGHPDGKIDEADIVFLGTTDPDFSGGFNNTFKYKSLDLNVYLYGVFNQLAFNGVKLKYIGYSSHMVEDGTNLWVEASKRWSSENPNGIYPSDATNSYMGADAWTLDNATFVRVKNITFGYNFPKKILNKEFRSVRIYADVQNPFIFTNWIGMDPEIAGANKAPYPNQRSYSIGINLEL